MGALMAGHLQNDEGEAQFEHNLQGNQAAEGVVVTLFRGAQKMRDQDYGDQTRRARPTARGISGSNLITLTKAEITMRYS
jgi:hypothetical protein